MMKIFIIEDSPNEFNIAKEILEEEFGCEVYPKNHDVFLTDFLLPYAQAYSSLKDDSDKNKEVAKKEVYTNLIKQIDGYADVYAYLVDINLLTNEGAGKLLYEDLKKRHKNNENVKVFKFGRDITEDTLSKFDMPEDQIEEFKSKLGLETITKGTNQNGSNPASEDNTDLLKTIAVLKSKINDLTTELNNRKGNKVLGISIFSCLLIYLLYTYITFSNLWGLKDFLSRSALAIFFLISFILAMGLFEKWKKFEHFKKDLSTIRSRLDSGITMFFYVFIIISLLLSITNFVKIFEKKATSLYIAENLFVVFLPLIIIMSFYFFYKRSMQKIITESSDYDVEEGIKLMNITKTFFISSIISYCIVKIIEIISEGEKELTRALKAIKDTAKPIDAGKLNYFKSILSESFNNYIILQIVLYFLMIIMLMVFYVKIKHHPTEKNK